MGDLMLRGGVREVLLGIRTVAEMVEAFRDEEECRRLLEAMVRLQDQPQRFEPDAQRQLGSVERRACRRRELKTAGAIGALIQTGPRSVSAHVPPRQRDRTLATTSRTNPSIGPHQLIRLIA
jgi:hypothetical protein